MDWQSFESVWEDNYPKSDYETPQFKAVFNSGGWTFYGMITLYRFGRVECSIYNQQEDSYETLEDDAVEYVTHYLRIRELK